MKPLNPAPFDRLEDNYFKLKKKKVLKCFWGTEHY